MKLRTISGVNIADSNVLVVFSLSVFYWIFTSFLQVFLSGDHIFFQRVLWPDSGEFLKRLLVICLFMVLGSHIQYTIKKRKQAEKALRDSEEIYRLHFEYASDAIFSIDSKLRITNISPSVESILGYKPKELINKKLQALDIIAPASKETIVSDFKQVLKGERSSSPIYEFISKSGEGKFIEISSAPLVHEGKTVGGICVARDVTARKITEEELRKTLATLRKAIGGTIQILSSTVEIRDPYTAGHQKRVADLSREIAKDMGLSEDQIDGIRVAGTIHDIGKISVPAEILSKPGIINEHEFALIKHHTRVGYELIKPIDFPWPIAQILYQHHERMDGSGYPQGLSGEDILIEARILSVADVVEAMATHRPYRASLGLEQALEEISQKKGTYYDPNVVDACVKIFKEKGYEFKQ